MEWDMLLWFACVVIAIYFSAFALPYLIFKGYFKAKEDHLEKIDNMGWGDE
jgi:hypothetical protein